MKLSRDLPKVIQPLLLCVVNFHSALGFYVHDGVLEEVFHVSIPKERYTDKEFYENFAAGASGGERDLEWHVFRDHVSKEVQGKLMTFFLSHPQAHICFFLPAVLRYQFLDDLDLRLRERVWRVVLGDFVHEHPFFFIRRAAELPTHL